MSRPIMTHIIHSNYLFIILVIEVLQGTSMQQQWTGQIFMICGITFLLKIWPLSDKWQVFLIHSPCQTLCKRELILKQMTGDCLLSQCVVSDNRTNPKGSFLHICWCNFIVADSDVCHEVKGLPIAKKPKRDLLSPKASQ